MVQCKIVMKFTIIEKTCRSPEDKELSVGGKH